MNDEFQIEETPSWYRPPASVDAWPEPAAPGEPAPPPPAAEHVEADAAGRGWGVREAPGDADGRASSPDIVEPPPVVMPWEAPPRPKSPTRRYVLLGVAMFALCGLAALVITNAGHGSHSISQPSTVGALTPVDSPQVDAAMDQLQSYERSAGATDVVTGVYGSTGRPQLLLLLVRSPLFPDVSRAASDPTFISGFAGGLAATGWSFDRSRATTTTVDGSTFECGPVTSSSLGMTLSTCAWVDAGVGGAVFDLTGQSVADTLNQAVQARQAGEH